MISSALRIDIERWAAGAGDRPLFRLAREGSLTKAMVARYIANVTFLCRHTTEHLVAARTRATELEDGKLADYFDHKFREERGHARWGEDDLASMGASAGRARPMLTPSIEALNRYLADVIQRDPALYLAYVAFAEYVTVLVGPQLLSNIEERCGVPRRSMTVVDNHIELDRDHAEESFGIIDDLVGDPRKLPAMRGALAEMAGYFDRFCIDVVEDVVATDEHGHHISAA